MSLRVAEIRKKFSAVLTVLTAAVLLSSCGNSGRRIVIWSSCGEFAQYIELFNSTHDDIQAVLVYKQNPADSLPPAKDEMPPDIIAGSWLRTDSTARNFKPLDYMFDRRRIVSASFYTPLLDSGKVGMSQYLLPVSFSLPAVIFSDSNRELVRQDYFMTLDEIRLTASEFNRKNRNGAFTRIGFSPLSDSSFLYFTAKIQGAAFRSEKNRIVWDGERLDSSVQFIRSWVNGENSSAQEEEDFAFKYLFMPDYRKVTSGRTLFAYTTSDRLFKIMSDQDTELDYRWISDGMSIPLEDSFITMGIYRDTENQPGATEFLAWFFSAETQKALLERKSALRLDTELFGIAGGFSAVREVTEQILPVYYTRLLSNLPPAQMLEPPQELPPKWNSYRTTVVEPYIGAAVRTDGTDGCPPIEEFESEWRKKIFD